MSKKSKEVIPEEVAATEEAQSAEPQAVVQNFPATVLVSKGADSIPVTVSNQAQLDRLIGEHGAQSIKVQS